MNRMTYGKLIRRRLFHTDDDGRRYYAAKIRDAVAPGSDERMFWILLPRRRGQVLEFPPPRADMILYAGKTRRPTLAITLDDLAEIVPRGAVGLARVTVREAPALP